MTARDTGRTTVALAVGTTIAGNMPVFLIGALFVQIQGDIAVPAWVLGFSVAMYWLFAAAVSTLSGRIVGAIGARRSTILSILGAVLSLVGSALLVPSWPWIAVWAGLGGAANGLGHPASNHLVSLRVAPRRLATAFGIKQGAVPFAAFLAGLMVPVVALTLGWRWGFAVAAVIGTLLLVAFLCAGPRRVPAGARLIRARVPLGSSLVRYLLLMSCATTLGAGAAGAASAFVVTAGIQAGLPDASAGVLLSMGSLLGAACRIGAGRVADRSEGRLALPLTAMLLVAGAVGTGLLAVDSTAAFVCGVILSLGLGWGWTGLTHFVVSRAAGPATPSATGIVQTGSYLGSAAGPLVFGIAFGAVGTDPGHTLVWLPVAAAQLVAAAVIVVLARTPPPPVPGVEA